MGSPRLQVDALIVGNGAYSGAGNNFLYRNDGNGTFRTATYYAAGWALWSVAVGDFNRDGRRDLAVANYPKRAALGEGTSADALGLTHDQHVLLSQTIGYPKA